MCNDALSAVLKHKRRRRRLSLSQASRRAKVHRNTLWAYEQGSADDAFERFRAVLRAVGVEVLLVPTEAILELETTR